jgi:urease accessory protein
MRMNEIALLRLLQLASPALPIGAFSWSQGLEQAVQAGWVHDEPSAQAWLQGVLQQGLMRLDVPILLRAHAHWQQGYEPVDWNRRLLAARETRELREEDRQLGAALIRLLHDLACPPAGALLAQEIAFATAFALAAVHWQIPVDETALAFLWTWTEHQVAAAVKLVPLGQTAGQRLLGALIPHLPVVAAQAGALTDDRLGTALPALALASSLHESQYSRLFRS